MTNTRLLQPYELTIAGDVYQGKPLAPEKVGMQAASFLWPITRRLSITLDVEDACAIATILSPGWRDQILPRSGRTLADLLDEARRDIYRMGDTVAGSCSRTAGHANRPDVRGARLSRRQ